MAEYFKDADASEDRQLDVIWRRNTPDSYEVRGAPNSGFEDEGWIKSVCEDRDFDFESELLDENEVPSWAL